MDALGSEGIPGLLYISTSQGHFSEGYPWIPWALKAFRGYCTLVSLGDTSEEGITHWYRLLQKSDMPPLDWRAIARGLATEVVALVLAGHTDPRKPS